MKKTSIILCAALLLAAACQKPEPERPLDNFHPDAYVLNEGNWGQNDASVSALTLSGEIHNNYFMEQNGRGLGDVAQDIQRYGSKIYIVVSKSNTIEVTDLNLKSIKKISLPDAQPRYIAFHDGKAYVSCYDKSVVRIDTATLKEESACFVTGLNPEGIAIADGSIFVAHGWEYGPDGSSILYDSTISVIDLDGFVETGHLTVGVNPSRIKVVDGHTLAVITLGDYGAHAASLCLVNTQDLEVRSTGIPVHGMDVGDGRIYAYECSFDYTTYANTVRFFTIDPTSGASAPLSLARTFSDPYCISLSPSGAVNVANSPYGSLGDLYSFSADGSEMWHAEAGYYPSAILWL